MECVICHEIITTVVSKHTICHSCENKPLHDVLRIYDQNRRNAVVIPSDFTNRVIPDSSFRNDLTYLIQHWPNCFLIKDNLFSSRHAEYLKDYIGVRMLFLGRNMADRCQKITNSLGCIRCDDSRLWDYLHLLKISIETQELSTEATNVWNEALCLYANALLPYVHIPLLQIVYDYAPLCQCRCTFPKDNLFSRSPHQIKIGCEFLACDTDHLACTCCQFACTYEQDPKNHCSMCTVLCKTCLKSPCHYSCTNNCAKCGDDICRSCQLLCDSCDCCVLCPGCAVHMMCANCKQRRKKARRT